MPLPCVNCKKLTAPDDAKFFAGVFLCSECGFIAEHFLEKGTEDLKGLLLMLKESIRVAAVRGELKLGVAEPMRDLSKKEVLQQIVTLREKMDASRSPTGPGDTPGQPGPAGRNAVPVRRVGFS